MTTYDNKAIAKQLEATANGDAYHGNSLYVARDFPWTTNNDRDLLTRYMYGSELLTDKAKLLEFAAMSMLGGEVEMPKGLV
jgi:hypothetical protein